VQQRKSRAATARFTVGKRRSGDGTAAVRGTIRTGQEADVIERPDSLPEDGAGAEAALAHVADAVLGRSAMLGDALAFAHMDPPPLEIAAQLVGLNARFNQNLLHRELSPFATEAEHTVIGWLAPVFGMGGGHMCGGSTLANLAALWCAREHGARQVIASADAHLSVPKAAHILGLPYRAVPVDAEGRIDRTQLGKTAQAALVLTAGTTGRGVIDPLERSGAAWLHVDAAWAGPLRLTRHSALLDGIERADSVAVSAHKWLYQPKESALVLFRTPDVQRAISFGGAYLAAPNVGVQGSRSAAAVPLLATLMALGRSGLAALIERGMADAQALADLVADDPRTELKQMPEAGVVNWRPLGRSAEAVLGQLGGIASRTMIEGELWARQVAANPHVDIKKVWERITSAL
jgi:L-2,4-diaminobutyrate decarboxylase